jgi:type II restriction enzyme
MHNFQFLVSTFQPTIFTRDYFCDFQKIIKNSFAIKVQLNILNALLGEKDIENKFIQILKQYPETRQVLPILLAVRNKFGQILDSQTKTVFQSDILFDKTNKLDEDIAKKLIKFFVESGLKDIFQNKNISNLNDYVFGIETGLDTNARKNRSGTLMEKLV